jgi:hypothetical protein
MLLLLLDDFLSAKHRGTPENEEDHTTISGSSSSAVKARIAIIILLAGWLFITFVGFVSSNLDKKQC